MAHNVPLSDAKKLTQSAIQANRDHQYSLRVYAERLEAELATLDKYLVSLTVHLVLAFRSFKITFM